MFVIRERLYAHPVLWSSGFRCGTVSKVSLSGIITLIRHFVIFLSFRHAKKIRSSVVWPTLLVAPCQPHSSTQLGLCSQLYALQSAPVTHWFSGYWETGRATKLSGHIQQELHLLSLPAIESQFLRCPVQSPATRLTELCWLLLYWIISTLLEKICHTIK